jgi:RNA polymerase sigma factor (sigma-70 family)
VPSPGDVRGGPGSGTLVPTMASTRAPRVAGAQDPTRVVEEERLARRAAAGDGAAFATLYDRYERRIFTYCQRLLVSSEDAADATQDAFLKVLARLPKLDPGRELNVSAYLYTAARNACYDMIGRRRRAEPVEELPEPAALGPDGLQRAALDEDPERAALLESFQADVQVANARLPERQREVLVLRELEERSYDEIAEIMDMNRNSVAQLISRARINLRDELRGTALASVAVSSADCERALPLISMRQDGQLRDGADREWLEAHVAGCSTCRVSVDAVEEAGVSYRAWLPIVPLEWLRQATIAKAGELVGADWSEAARSPRDPGEDGNGSRGHGEDGGGNGRGPHEPGGGTAAHGAGAAAVAHGPFGGAGLAAAHPLDDAADDAAHAADEAPGRRRRRLVLLAALALLVLLAGTAAVVIGKDDAPATDAATPATPADDGVAPTGTGGGQDGDAAGTGGSGTSPGTTAAGAPAGAASPAVGTTPTTTVDAKTTKPGGSTRRGGAGAGGRRTTSTPGATAPSDGGGAKPRKPAKKPDKPSGGGDGSRTPSSPPSSSTPPTSTPPTSTPPTSTPPTSTPPTSTPPSTGTPGGGGTPSAGSGGGSTPSGGGGRTPSGGGGRTPSGGGGRTPSGGGSAPCPAGAVC